MNDLIVLVADKNMQHAVSGALERPQSLGIRDITFEIVTHANRDPGVRKTGAELLRIKKGGSKHGVMMLDFEGSGTNKSTGIELESELDEQLGPVWASNAKAIVIEPELEIWMWGAENAIKEVFNWNQPIGIRKWIESQGYEVMSNGKPARPKEALQSVMRVQRKPLSSALYYEISRRISLRKCADPAFVRLREQLLEWFGPNS